MTFLRRWRGFFIATNSYALLGFEVVMSLLSLRCAYTLLTNQHYFDDKVSYDWFVHNITGHEWLWGMLGAAAALLKIVGLIGTVMPRRNERTAEFAFFTRELGWGASACFWGCMGLSFSIWDTNNMLGCVMLALAALSVGFMLTGPVMPDEG